MGDDSEAPPGVWRELDALVAKVQRARTAVAAAQAQEASLLAQAVGLVEARAAQRKARGVRFGNDLPLREVSAELGAAMRVGDRTVQRRIDDSHTLMTRFSATFDAWQAGRIDRQHVMTIIDEGVVLADATARGEYETLVLAVAEVESAGRMREICRVIAARIDPDASALQRKNALRGRDIRVIDLDDGMARLLADLPAPLAYAIMDRLTQFARTVADAEQRARDDTATAEPDADPCSCGTDSCTDPDHVRTLGQIRTDVLADLLLTAIPTGHSDGAGDALTGTDGRIQLTIPVTTAAGIDDQPALLTGYGPIDTGLARRLMATTPVWDRVLTDPTTGLPLAVDRYRPSHDLNRFLDTRDERCRFPGCTLPVWRCDADHTIPAAEGGETSHGNLAHLCRRHHTLKGNAPWHLVQLGNGHLHWTSPTGRTYTDHVPATLRFVPARSPAADPPPPDGSPDTPRPGNRPCGNDPPPPF